MKRVLSILGILVKIIDVLVFVVLIGGLCFWFIWRPIKIASYKPIEPEHLEQKKSYLEDLANNTVSNTNLPNIILLNFDDMGYGDLSCYGNRLLNTLTWIVLRIKAS